MQSFVRLLIRFRHFSSNPRNAWAALVTYWPASEPRSKRSGGSARGYTEKAQFQSSRQIEM
jgi:hypothetical protein